ncbi:uncharacterized protein LOC126354178 isoform X2 [Schistocerca gregaria]|uniref:uncharacterized protein LOC126354178 isoform X2 n=1 Tax=Schistocerca gregaria TaxID=7010 RepID=UPI00211E925D|nr:uncharacterized protein LOC126354178 isoform X2 [Schistocerca gregaria]
MASKQSEGGCWPPIPTSSPLLLSTSIYSGNQDTTMAMRIIQWRLKIRGLTRLRGLRCCPLLPQGSPRRNGWTMHPCPRRPCLLTQWTWTHHRPRTCPQG